MTTVKEVISYKMDKIAELKEEIGSIKNNNKPKSRN